MPEKLIYDHAIRSMFRGHLDRLSERALQRLKVAGINPQGPWAPAYPAAVWAACANILAEELHPGVEAFEAQRRVARATVDAYANELVGRAMFSLLRLIGLERISRRMTQNFRSGSNFQEARVTRISEVPLSEEIWISDVTGCPGFYLGLLEGGIAHTTRGDLQVVLASSDGVQAVYRTFRPSETAPR